MMIETLIRRFETLDPEVERKYLERLLYSLTGFNRWTRIKDKDSESRLQKLARVSEINRYVLKRVLALAEREKDTFFTVAHTWNRVNEYTTGVAALEEWV